MAFYFNESALIGLAPGHTSSVSMGYLGQFAIPHKDWDDVAFIGLFPNYSTFNLGAFIGLLDVNGVVVQPVPTGGSGPLRIPAWKSRHIKAEEANHRDSILMQNRIASILAHRNQEEEEMALLMYYQKEAYLW